MTAAPEPSASPEPLSHAAGKSPPAFNIPPLTLSVCAAILVAWLAIGWGPDRLSAWLLDHFAVFTTDWTAWHDGVLPEGRTLWMVAALLGHAFLHVEGIHLAANLGFLLAFASLIERAYGVPRTALILTASAVGGAVAQIAADWSVPAQMIGASGAVSGAVAAACRLFLSARRDRGAGRRLAFALIGFTIGINLFIALIGGEWLGVGAVVAWQAHLGGFAVGFLLGGAPRGRKASPVAG